MGKTVFLSRAPDGHIRSSVLRLQGKRIVRTVLVARSCSLRKGLEASGRNFYLNDVAIKTMPRCVDKKTALVYFKPDLPVCKNGRFSCVTLDAEYKRRGLVPDPRAQIGHNVADPEFADAIPNACQWTDNDGNYYYAVFDRRPTGDYAEFGRWNDEREIRVDCGDSDWYGSWWFGGILK